MKERPILFSAPMVMALLDNTKTQTRRVANTGLYAIGARFHGVETAARELDALSKKCPYGQPGNRLWVREAWAKVPVGDGSSMGAIYRADGEDAEDGVAEGWEFMGKWTPSIHMPHWASRINLEIVNVRVERLQDISEADALAEGIEGCDVVINGRSQGKTWRDYSLKCDDPCEWFGSPIRSYRTLWESINGAGSWDANPWVWVIEFRRLTA